jgi:hypothetical protein
MFINQLRFFVGEYHFFLPWHLGILAWSQICVCECLLNHHFLVGVFQYTVDGIGHDFFESPMGRPHPIQIRSWYLEQGNQHRKLMGQSAKLTKCKWPSLSYRYYLYDILWYYNLSQLHIYIYITQIRQETPGAVAVHGGWYGRVPFTGREAEKMPRGRDALGGALYTTDGNWGLCRVRFNWSCPWEWYRIAMSTHHCRDANFLNDPTSQKLQGTLISKGKDAFIAYRSHFVTTHSMSLSCVTFAVDD